MESDVKQRLIQFIKMIHLTQKAFEDRCGMSNGYIANIRKSIGRDKLLSITQQFPQLNRDWLLYGEGDMLRPHAQVVQNNHNGDNNYMAGGGNNVRCSNCGGEVPVLTPDEIQGAPIIPTALSRQPNVDILKYLDGRTTGVERSTITAEGIALDLWHRVRDDSLSPNYLKGDMLGLWSYPQGQENPIPGKLYAVDTYSNGLIIRKLFPENDGYRAHAINTEEFPDFLINKGDVIRVYRVMMMARL